jgi:hypothetical protein
MQEPRRIALPSVICLKITAPALRIDLSQMLMPFSA